MKTFRKQLTIAALTIAALSAASTASAAVVSTYTDLNAWRAASPGNVEATEFANGTFGTPLPQAATLTIGSQGVINLTGFTDGLDGTNRGGYPVLSTNSTGTLSVQPGSGIFASLMFLGANNTGGQILVTLSTGDSFTITTAANAPIAWGFVSDTAVTSITVAPFGGGSLANVADFFAGPFSTTDPTAVPETTSALLVGGALLMLGVFRKFRSMKARPGQSAVY